MTEAVNAIQTTAFCYGCAHDEYLCTKTAPATKIQYCDPEFVATGFTDSTTISLGTVNGLSSTTATYSCYVIK
jgi:hypothetical protein